jgi:hypothetical protein
MTDGEFTKALTQKAVPRWLKNTYAYRILRAIGLQLDLQKSRLIEGVWARFPGYQPPYQTWGDGSLSWGDEGLVWGAGNDDRLAYISRDRLIRRGRDEYPETFAERTLTWLDDHKQRGNVPAMLRQILAYYQPNPFPIRCVSRNGLQHSMAVDGTLVRSQLGAFSPDASPELWCRLWIYYDHPSPTIAEDGLWGDPGVWDDGGVWDLDMTEADLEKTATVPREWLAAHIGEAWLVFEYDSGDVAIRIK